MNASRDKLMNIHLTGSLIGRLATGLFVLVSVVACATVDTQSAQPLAVETVEISDQLASAKMPYNTQDFDVALKEFHTISLDPDVSVSSRRMAYLGQALIYLSSDKNFHSVDNAKLALRSAGQVEPSENEEFSLAADLLLDAVNITIGTESRYAQLKSKTGNSNSEVARLKAERDALLAENSKLQQEQVSLRDALERLKNLTLGN